MGNACFHACAGESCDFNVFQEYPSTFSEASSVSYHYTSIIFNTERQNPGMVLRWHRMEFRGNVDENDCF